MESTQAFELRELVTERYKNNENDMLISQYIEDDLATLKFIRNAREIDIGFKHTQTMQEAAFVFVTGLYDKIMGLVAMFRPL